MDAPKMIDGKDSIKIVTDNKLITASGLSELSLKARKILYMVMAQCRQTDQDFFIYEITPSELAERLGVGSNHVYELADGITGELMSKYIEVRQEGTKRFKKYNLFSMCEYDDDRILRFKLNPDMTEFLLNLKKSFTQTILGDYLQMKSPYSMAIWHLMQREMKGRKPATDRVSFYLSLDELRTVTGTQNKLKQMVQFKERVLDKANHQGLLLHGPRLLRSDRLPADEGDAGEDPEARPRYEGTGGNHHAAGVRRAAEPDHEI